MMVKLLDIFFVAILLSDKAAAFTYWVDPLCNGKPQWNDILAEAFGMSSRAAARLASNSDTDFANVFKNIFWVTKNDPTLYQRPLRFQARWHHRLPAGTAYDIVQCD
jgi:hypothetical protein